MNTKKTTFKGVSYDVPEWAIWIWQNSDGTIYASQYQPFQINHWTGWEVHHGQHCVVQFAEVKPHIERVC